MVSIILNGTAYLCRLPEQRVSDLVREIVPRIKHSETVLVDGDKIEVVAAVGGG